MPIRIAVLALTALTLTMPMAPAEAGRLKELTKLSVKGVQAHLLVTKIVAKCSVKIVATGKPC